MTTLNKRLLPICPAVALLALLSFNSQGRADNIQTLVNDNSSVAIDLSSQTGMYQWNVDGNNYLAQQWFWYRIGPATPQNSIDTLTLGAVNNTGSSLTADYTGVGFSLSVSYQLTGGSPGSGLSDVTEQLAINNTSASPLDLHFFQFSHFLLGSSTVALGKATVGPNAGLYDEALQQGSGVTLNENVDTVNTPGANHGEAAIYPHTINSLNGTPGYTLNDNTSAGPGDVTWALEWDKVLSPAGQAGSSLDISKDKNLTIPEPSTWILLSLGLGSVLLRRRR
ncbi:exported hypothetical protein [Verrucomicrobia bacterium]|nr:exported hypothetical protein [Verrucomicrobiota bacterium]